MAEAHPDTNFPYPIPARYQCVKLLGHGGSGLVYKAYDQRLRRHVAIKFARSPSIVSRHRLVNEARLLSAVDHPALCRVFDIGEPETPSSSLFMVLEYIDGKPLNKVRSAISVYETVAMVKSLVDGVCRMHEAGYAHSDITPQNIMVRSLGTSKKEQSKRAVLVDLSISAPSSPASIQRDIYQLSALLLSLLTDMKPEQFYHHPIISRPGLPIELSRIIKRALSLDPNSRFHECQEFQKELEHWLNRYRLKKRLFWFTAANAAVLVVPFILFLTLHDTAPRHFLEDYSSKQDQYAHAVVFAHYSQYLANQGDRQRATEQAELSLDHFDHAIANNPDALRYHEERTRFILTSGQIFSHTQITTMLLNAINELGDPAQFEEKPAAHYLLAKMYLALAKLNNEHPHLVERWKDSALRSVKAAIQNKPNADRYQKLQNEISQYQSSAGTD
ncbi:protein kinase domain-containing protein [Idiomarina sp. HP20-50]|uniref:protein kinase domain-containing protein n=1 Tax=Idiomarina sp. HP20-50 TaxID=3070813 RepID=UPI00294B8EB1|nr:protein kinase [Idiomarina sp. HP20-50]MDV6315610.1 protein kinase [Idiomarina sp. HP20-50]